MPVSRALRLALPSYSHFLLGPSVQGMEATCKTLKKMCFQLALFGRCCWEPTSIAVHFCWVGPAKFKTQAL